MIHCGGRATGAVGSTVHLLPARGPVTITRPLVSLAGVVSRPRSVDHRPSKITAENSPRKWPLSEVKRTLWLTSPHVRL